MRVLSLTQMNDIEFGFKRMANIACQPAEKPRQCWLCGPLPNKKARHAAGQNS